MRLDLDDPLAVLELDLHLQGAAEVVDGDQGAVEETLQAVVRYLELGLIPVAIVVAVVLAAVAAVFSVVATPTMIFVDLARVVVLVVIVVVILPVAAAIIIVIVSVVPAAIVPAAVVVIAVTIITVTVIAITVIAVTAIAVTIIATAVVVIPTISAIIIIIGKRGRGKRMVRSECED